MIYTGDCLKILPTLDAESVQCCVTSPPYYGLRDYGTAEWVGGNKDCNHKQGTARNDGGRVNTSGFHGSSKADSDKGAMNYKTICGKCGAVRTDNQIGLEETPEQYIAKLVAVFREVRRVLRNDGVLWLNLGDSYWGGKGENGSSKARATADERGYVQSGGTVQMSKRPQDGRHNTIKPKDLVGIPWRVAFALQADGWYLRSEIIWAKANPMPESVTDRPTKSHEQIFLLSKNARYYYDAEAVKEPCQSGPSDIRKMNESLERIGGKHKDLIDPLSKASAATNIGHKRAVGDPSGRNRRSVWNINTVPFPGSHFAVFPPAIPEICIKAGSRPGDTILDPFSGAGTTGNVAERLGRAYIGIELNPAYSEMGEKRIDAARLPLAEQWG